MNSVSTSAPVATVVRRLLAGTAALFAALCAVMFVTRKVDWFADGTTEVVA